MNLEQRILQALGPRALSTEELSSQLGSEVSSDDISKALFHLREQKSWVVKHPVFGDGCKTCACSVSYVWRLSLSGRQELAKQ
jgi:hypothetical protein